MRVGKFVLAALLALAATAKAAGATDCTALTPWGQPTLNQSRPVTILCHSAYVVAHDDQRLVADWVAWVVSPEHAIGCLRRTDNFAADPDLPVGHRAKPSDYSGSGYDQGHFAPAQDFSYSAETEAESFYMSNMSPQVPALNRMGWEQVEAQTREWARSGSYGTLYLMDGPIFRGDPKTIGADDVAVPDAYWKVVVSPSTGQALAFIMPNAPVAKRDADTTVVSIAEVERQAGIGIPLPGGIDKAQVAAAWPANVAGYTRAKKSVCSRPVAASN
jgi:endonuclease G